MNRLAPRPLISLFTILVLASPGASSARPNDPTCTECSPGEKTPYETDGSSEEPPRYRLPHIQYAAQTSVTIVWKTKDGADICEFFHAVERAPLPSRPSATVQRTGRQTIGVDIVGSAGRRLRKSNAEHGFEVTLTGLTPGTWYHYRVVRKNSRGQGAVDLVRDARFKTSEPRTQTSFSTVFVSDIFSAYSPDCNELRKITDPNCSYHIHRHLRDRIFETKRARRTVHGEARTGFDFIVSPGDVSNEKGKAWEYAEHLFGTYNGNGWRGGGKDILKGVPFFPVPGNHDHEHGDKLSHGGRYYRDAFRPLLQKNGTGKTYYSFDYANAHFIGLDIAGVGAVSATAKMANGSESYAIASLDDVDANDSPQVKWLKDDLKRVRGQTNIWKIAFFHFPLRDGGVHKETAKRLALLLEREGVDLIVVGHWERLGRESTAAVSGTQAGIPTLVLGSGGARSDRKHFKHVNFTLADIKGDDLRLVVVDSQGASIAEGTLKRGSRNLQWSRWPAP
ncbi:MAG: metallophosphoesterase family protein [Deltaproteobacteria bacterium]|nr:metallophosphoesterase family protein [Deltaproteobacteria bacterium]